MNNIREDAIKVINEIMENSDIKEGDIFIVGCSSSEMIGNQMGTSKDGETDAAVDALYEVINESISQKKAYLAVQCCEHLNRAVVIDRKIAQLCDLEIVNVIPQPHAGGAFAVKHYNSLKDPVVVENIKQKAVAGLDIGGVMIGMHIHPVVVPIRLKNKNIGRAIVLAGRYRPKYIGGQRAVYDTSLF
ncbi:MAG: TIGR01440 family protein [Lachnospiraceae bacterium]|nr:TIGR01440 family protein [Lachnospiraceae bacterium]